MARTIRDAALQTREARGRLKARGKPYYRAIEEGLHLGYRKPQGRRGSPAVAGKWVVRRYIGGQAYEIDTIAAADDFSDADGVNVLSFKQAQDAARAKIKVGPLTVRKVVEDYLQFLEDNRKTAHDARYRAAAFIYPALGDEKVEALSTDQLQHWHTALAKAAPRVRTKAGERQQHREIADDDESRRRRQSTANRTLTVLKAALNRAWRKEKVASNAAWHRVEPFKGVNAARVRYLTVAEAKRLINAADPEFRPLVQAALADRRALRRIDPAAGTRLQSRHRHARHPKIQERQAPPHRPDRRGRGAVQAARRRPQRA